MTLIAGNHRVDDRGLTFDLGEGFDFTAHRTCFILQGDNGVGKTSFLEKVLIPALTGEAVPFLCLAQDLSTQMLTLRALMALQGRQTARANDLDVIASWIKGSPTARVFMLDEFDKYAPDLRFIFDCSAGFIQTYIMVSHLATHSAPLLPARFRLRRLAFTATATVGAFQTIAVSEAAP
jgi:hypothetical protein